MAFLICLKSSSVTIHRPHRGGPDHEGSMPKISQPFRMGLELLPSALLPREQLSQPQLSFKLSPDFRQDTAPALTRESRPGSRPSTNADSGLTLGRRVLFKDMDLSAPQLHWIFYQEAAPKCVPSEL